MNLPLLPLAEKVSATAFAHSQRLKSDSLVTGGNPLSDFRKGTSVKHYELTTCYLKDHDLCMIDHAPDKIRHISYRLSEGGCIANEYPRDRDDAVVYMDEKWGMLIGGLVSNTSQFLIVCSKLKDVIVDAFPAADPHIQVFPVSICDHKKRLASSDYWFVNPLGTIDSLDLAKSEIKRGSDGDVIRIKRMVLSRAKLRNQQPLFRLKENPRSYIIRHDLIMAIKDLNLPIPNIYVEELEVTEDGGKPLSDIK